MHANRATAPDMRIVAGQFGGRPLTAPPGQGTRPTSDRVREAIFNILGAPPPATTVLDLFAGSGAMGLEALSRGASHVVFVEKARPALQTLRRNIDELGAMAQCTIWPQSAELCISKSGPTPYRWVFIDPPYRTTLATEMTVALTATQLTHDAVVVIEHDRRNAPAPQLGILTMYSRRKYGDTEVSFYRQEPMP